MIVSGRLTERIKVERSIETDMPDGSVSRIWTTIHEPFCDVIEKDASIDTIATHDNIEQVAIITLRYNPEVSYLIGDRITWRGRILKLHSFKVDKKRTWTEIIAKMHNETTAM